MKKPNPYQLLLIPLALWIIACQQTHIKNPSESSQAREFLRLVEAEIQNSFSEELQNIHQKTPRDSSRFLSAEKIASYTNQFIRELDTTEFFTYHQTQDAFHFKQSTDTDNLRCPDMVGVEYLESSHTFKLSVDHSQWDSTGCVSTYAVYWIQINAEDVKILALNEPS